MMNPLYYTLVLILLLLTYYHGGFCLQSDSSSSASDLANKIAAGATKATTEEINQMEHSKNEIKPKNSIVKKTEPLPKKVNEKAKLVQDEDEASKSVKQEIKKPDARPPVENQAPVQSDHPLNPEKHVQDTMTEHGLGVKAAIRESENTEGVPLGNCDGNEANGVLCDDVKKVISPELPKLSREFVKVPPEAVKVQEEGIKAPPEVTEEQSKTESITEPEPVKQDEAPQEQKKEEEVPKPAESEPPKAAEVAAEKKAPVAGENTTEPVAEGDVKKVEGEVTTEKKEGGSSDTETVTPPINTIVQHEEEDMPSFNEWKKQQHEAKKEEEKEKSKQNGHTTQPGSTGSQLTRPSTMRTNYASLSCGAKVLSHNPEVQHASYTLNDNKDEYMINPCSANKWFIVELCEPIQVKFVEVANFELFSSLPKDVRLHTSDKYPSKDWKLLDTYTATEERKIHIFPVMGQQLYSKYLKVEVLSHFGTEHFCPLTLLRVFGTSYAEIDDDDDHDDVNTDEHVQGDGASSIFTSATDIVMNVVKKVLNGGEDQQKPLDGPFRPNNKEDANTTEDYDLPCLQGRADPKKDQIKPDVPRPASGVLQGSNVILDTVIRPSVPYPTIPQPVADVISRTAFVVNVVNYYGATVLGAMNSLFKNCHVCETGQSKYRSFAPLIGHGPCIYYCILTKCWQRYGYCCKNCYKKSDLKTNPIPATEQIDLYSTAVISSVKATVQPSAAPQTSADGVVKYETPTANAPATATSTSVHIPLTTPEPVQEGITIQPTKTFKSIDDVLGSVQSSVVSTSLSHQNTQSLTLSSDVKQEHTSSTESVLSSSALSSSMSGSTMGPDVAQGSQSMEQVSTPAMIKSSAVVTESVPPKEEEKLPPVQETKKVDPPVEVGQQNEKSNGISGQKEEQPEAARNGGSDQIQKDVNGNGEQFVIVDLPVAGAASAGKRESAIMRLNNRVKALELNMSLSSRYLEELSQRYKKQMEAMYRSFNITIGRLMNTSKWAEQSDQRQKEKTSKLHARIDELTLLVDTLTKDLDKMNVKHLENHLVFLVLETMVMFILFLMCSRRNKQRTTPAELQELLENMPDHPKRLQRHNSDPAISTPRKPAILKARSLSDVETKHSESESKLFIIEPTNFPFLNENKDLSKKKKRKKSKKFLHVQSSDQLSGLQCSPSNTSTMASAGLLFEGNNRQSVKAESVNGVRMRTLSRSSSLNHIDVIFENSSSSCTASSQSTEGFSFENMTSNEAARQGPRKHSPRSDVDSGAIARNNREQQEFQLRRSTSFPKKYGKKFVEDVGARYNGHGPSRRFPTVDQRSTNSDPAQYLRLQRQFVDNAESCSDTGQKRKKFRKKYDFDTHSDNGKFQNFEYVDNAPDLAMKPKKKFDSGGKKKPVDSRLFYDGQPQPVGQGRGRGRGGYRGRGRQEMDGLGGFKTWVSYRH
ncbi:SUN domain-containing ossification factor-like isoform X2 [Lineus longissimus]|uniref:SUN domain-containing ossification factor-like isoform X2 n=1 Tax=Lineus longissimus TaxID=88925 RepID=UPI00315D10CC